MHEILMDVRGIPPDPRLLKSRESRAVVVQCESTTPSEYDVDHYRVETLTHSLQWVPQPRPKLASVRGEIWAFLGEPVTLLLLTGVIIFSSAFIPSVGRVRQRLAVDDQT
jgi:hypothetical protein